jgi:hypothetical protein
MRHQLAVDVKPRGEPVLEVAQRIQRPLDG